MAGVKLLDHDEIIRLYGPWTGRTPDDASALLEGYSGRWWIAGGWAIDAFTGTLRRHGDLDIGIPRGSLKHFVDFVSPRLDVWAASGSLTPIFSGENFDLPPGCGNVWLRAGGASPWEYDVFLEHVHGETWAYKRDPHLTRPLHECLWNKDGITFLRPEVQLLLKAKHRRDKDLFDLERCLPLLDAENRWWLADALAMEAPDHPWLAALSH